MAHVNANGNPPDGERHAVPAPPERLQLLRWQLLKGGYIGGYVGFTPERGGV